MKAIILAAGPGKITQENPTPTSASKDTDSWILQPLGDRAIIDYVVDLARTVVDPDDLIVVIDRRGNAVEKHLIESYAGESFHYVEQAVARGTGHAVLQAESLLAGYDRNVLVLFGDSPFFRRASIQGLINRHRLKEASLTLLTGESEHKLQAGRVLRAQTGQIVDILEADQLDSIDAAPQIAQIQEFNLGASVFKADLLWGTLHQVAIEHQNAEKIPLTACVRTLLHSGQTVESYRALDEDEHLGINTDADLDQATIILEKRQLRPRRIEEHNIIRFGTGGWRALIGEGFTLDNVRRLCQSIANDVIRAKREQDGVLIGFDRRFLADAAAESAAEVFAGNGVHVQLLTEPVPTPLVTYATAAEAVLYGLIFTASHNPPQWNGLKVFASDGALPLDEETKSIEDEANRLTPLDVIKVDLDIARRSGMVQNVDYTNPYIDAIEALIDMEAIRRARLRVVVDPMYGVGQNALETILTEARCRVSTIHGRHDPLFGGRSPAPDPGSLNLLISSVREGDCHLGLAMDGDADRIAIIDNNGAYISTNELLILLYYYLQTVRRERGGVTRNLATTHLLDRLAKYFGEQSYEVPVGFKHVAASMKAHNVLLAGESSGGLAIRGHILGKDGIFACALVVEMIARTGRGIGEMLGDIYEKIGYLVSREVNVPATPDLKIVVPRRLSESTPREIAGLRVERVSTADGTKFYLENDAWLLLRFSGTEPLLRIFAEGESEEQVEALINWARTVVGYE